MILKINLNPQVQEPVNAIPLIKRKAAWSGSVADWGSSAVDGLPISASEVEALKRGSKTKTVNAARAMRVKALMALGKNPIEIHRSLRRYGTGYGLSSIKHDHAALSPFMKR